MDVILATQNAGKVKELGSQLAKFGVTVHSLLTLEDDVHIDETGQTFKENAIIKAEFVSRKYNKVVFADDSGLSVDALNGRPGVYSARYAGENASDQENINKLIRELEGISFDDRTATFHCALAIATPNQETVVFHGKCEGFITETQQGEGGFGYDPVFYVPRFKRTMAELTSDEKNSISHRGNALHQLQKNWSSLNFARGIK
jgi:XTP/dITP diphosphohydrolase